MAPGAAVAGAGVVAGAPDGDAMCVFRARWAGLTSAAAATDGEEPGVAVAPGDTGTVVSRRAGDDDGTRRIGAAGAVAPGRARRCTAGTGPVVGADAP
ncbi:hypothetical protein ACFYQA_29325 [Streptomyces sp. NPDC005774]|uniref:hypothetical protein n=1 Tax=Streptomyces sp. NPDC005774 TaxID=3364728 RepID=UPI003694620D